MNKYYEELQIVQHNTAKTREKMHSCLDTAGRNGVHFILLQEPWIIGENYEITISHPNYYCILPTNPKVRPRVAIYAKKVSPYTYCYRSDLCQDPDILILDILEVNNQNPILQIINIYNEKSLENQNLGYTIPRALVTIKPAENTLICGDFNAHHQWWNSKIKNGIRTTELIEWLNKFNFELINAPDVDTFHRKNARLNKVSMSVIDLAFGKGRINNNIKWAIDDENATGSDHALIRISAQIRVNPNTVDTQLTGHYNLERADWEAFHKELWISFLDAKAVFDEIEKIINPTLESLLLLEEGANTLTKIIQNAANNCIPVLKKTDKSKPWWNNDLTQLRKKMAEKRRVWKENRTNQSYARFRIARTTYFTAIKEAKTHSWDKFLMEAQGTDVFKALKYTKMRRVEKLPIIQYKIADKNESAINFQEKCKAFQYILFPKPPESEPPNWENYQQKEWDWPIVNSAEIELAIITSSAKKAPGPDHLSFAILQKVYKTIGKAFNQLYPKLIEIGYHPRCWKEAIGVILPKPNKPDYTNPKAYRVIALLNCLGKIAEKIIAKRLAHLANTTDLLDDDQLGGRAQKSAIDAALSITHDIQIAKNDGLITSALFLDIKGAFDHVSKNQLLKICIELGLPKSLYNWINSFLIDRFIQLAFDGETQPKNRINIGIPQGSPVSPILFLIYIQALFKEIKSVQFRIPSYIDDIGIITTGKNAAENCKKLNTVVGKIFNWANQNATAFDKDKTELIHFFEKIEDTTGKTVTLPDRTIVIPKKEVKWLGIWFDKSLTFKTHVEKRLALATRTLHNIIRLSGSEKGLSFKAIRQLYIACITTISDYGVQIWWKGQKGLLEKFQKLQNKALKVILGAFKTSPIEAMEIEAAVPPPEIRFEKICKGYALRILKIVDKNHPIRQRAPDTYPPGNTIGIPDLNLDKYLDWDQGKTIGIKKEYPSQLYRVLNTISKDIPSWDVQNSPELLSPWAEPPGKFIDFAINLVPKEKALEIHQKLVTTLIKKPKNIVIYTDGAKNETTKGLAAANCTYYWTEIKEKGWRLSEGWEVQDAEMYAILRACKMAQSQSNEWITDAWIFTDSQKSVKKLQNHLGNDLITRKILDLAKTLKIVQKISVHIHWIKAHIGIEGNEKADKKAKLIASLPTEKPLPGKLPIRVIEQNIKNSVLLQWENKWKKCKSKGRHYTQFETKPNWKPNKITTTKKLWATYIQLKLGHGYFKSYLQRLSDYEANCSKSCRAIQTPSHLLFNCKIQEVERSQFKKDLKEQCGMLFENNTKVLLNLALNTQKGLVETLKYLEKSKIATRQWMLHIDPG
jgi:ribonuclease HI